MSLAAVEIPAASGDPPADVRRLLDDAQRRIQQLLDARPDEPIVAFVPCDFLEVYQALAAVAGSTLLCGRRFAEWGSGMGVVTCLAARLGFDAVGIEIEPHLVAAAVELAARHKCEAQFFCGSFLPEGAEADVESDAEIIWLRTDGTPAYDQIGLEPDDFDLVFAYPWPGEEQVLFDLFNTTASVGALLLTYHGQEGVQLQRKVTGRLA